LTSGNAQYVYNTALSNASSFWYVPTNNMTGNSYIDTNNLTEGWHDVKIRVEDINENYDEFSFSIHTGIKTDVTDYTENLLPTEYHLLQNFPNPFNPSTTIRFALPKKSLVSLGIFNEHGGLVRELITQQLYDPGWRELVWDGTNTAGLPVASGAYFYRLNAESLGSGKKFSQTKKLMLVR